MKLTKSQIQHLAEVTKDCSVVIFGALVVSGIFSQEPIRMYSIIIGIILFLAVLIFSLILKKKGNSDG
jgi:small-conductance mechanosensitive channel